MKRALLLTSLLVGGLVLAAVAADGKAPAKKQDGAPQDQCVTPAAGPLGLAKLDSAAPTRPAGPAAMPLARVGKPAPDFEANAFVDGGFRPLKLSDFRGKWVVLCFYPGDFTFV